LFRSGRLKIPGLAGDVNVDGKVNLTDMALAKSRDGNAAACP